MIANEIIPWGDELPATDDVVALESFTPEITMGGQPNGVPTNFKPINIVTDGGAHYATVYVCHCIDGSMASQQVAIWLSSLKETDKVNLTVLSLMADIPPGALINLMTALTSTKAQLNIQLDQVVYDGLAYFYLIPEKITKGSEGALFIPSYSLHRSEDMSGPIRAIHDFFKWMVAKAVERGLLTKEEGERLDSGSHVAVPDERFGEYKNG